jgi:hypothetical protein
MNLKMKMMIMMNPNPWIAEDINIDEYLSNDDTPDYKHKHNYSDDDEERGISIGGAMSFQ